MITRLLTESELAEINARNRASRVRPDKQSGRWPGDKFAKSERVGRSKEPKQPRQPPARKHKYNAQLTEVDGFLFASKKEAKVYGELKLREKAGEIADLKLQPVIHCDSGGHHICDYRADFLYFDRKLQKMVWLDCKGFRTAIYKLKKKIVFALTRIEITEI